MMNDEVKKGREEAGKSGRAEKVSLRRAALTYFESKTVIPPRGGTIFQTQKVFPPRGAVIVRDRKCLSAARR